MSNLGSDLALTSTSSTLTTAQNFVTVTTRADGSSASSEPNGQESPSLITSKRQKKLRRPNQETLSRLLVDLSDSENMHGSSHNFSVDAPEFIPKQSTKTESTDLNTKSSNLSVAAAEFVPRSNVMNSNAQEFVPHMNDSSFPASLQETDELPFELQRLSIRPAHLSSSTADYSHSDILDEFKNVLFLLTSHPGNVEEFLMSFKERLLNIHDNSVLTNIVEMLFEQSVTESNFRYTGARICKYLSKNLKDHSSYKNFRGVFLKRCKTEFDKRESLLSSEEDISRLCGLTLFIGELFVHLEVESDGHLIKINILMQALRDLLLTLLKNPMDSTVKCAAQLLKFCGAALEDTSSKQDPGFLDEVFKLLKGLSGDTSLGKTSQILISSVLNLRDSDWGRKDMLSAPDIHLNSGGGYSCTFDQIEPVFYDEHGHQITREEAGFAQEIEETFPLQEYVLNEEEEAAYERWEAETQYGTWSSGVEYGDEFASGDMNNELYEEYGGMGEEIEAAYEDFLQSQLNQQR